MRGKRERSGRGGRKGEVQLRRGKKREGDENKKELEVMEKKEEVEETEREEGNGV